MARFYGSIQGARGEATRLGHRNSGLMTVARSYSGSVVVELYADGEEDCVRISVAEGSTTRGEKLIYNGPLSRILEQGARKTMLQALVQEELTA
jgi:hypothetical protein